MKLDGVPAFTASAQLTLSGEAAPSAEIRVEANGKQIAKTSTKKDGSFSVKVKLPEEGDVEVVVTAGEDTALFTIRYEMPDARLDITEPEDTTFTGENVTVRGVTRTERHRVYRRQGNEHQRQGGQKRRVCRPRVYGRGRHGNLHFARQSGRFRARPPARSPSPANGRSASRLRSSGRR